MIAWRSVSWAMLKSVPNADPKKIPTIRNGIAVERCESGMKTKKAEERIDGQTIVGPKPNRRETQPEPAAASSAPMLPSMKIVPTSGAESPSSRTAKTTKRAKAIEEKRLSPPVQIVRTRR